MAEDAGDVSNNAESIGKIITDKTLDKAKNSSDNGDSIIPENSLDAVASGS